MRTRAKQCFQCKEDKDVLYRCRYQPLNDWIFLCGGCLKLIKSEYESSYQYGGTWKANKK